MALQPGDPGRFILQSSRLDRVSLLQEPLYRYVAARLLVGCTPYNTKPAGTKQVGYDVASEKL